MSVACNGKTRCIVPAYNRVFGDPCRGTRKYLGVTYTCLPSVIMQRKYVCQDSMLRLSCPPGRKLMVGYAAFGRQSTSVCTKTSLPIVRCRSSQQSGAIVKAKCNGKTSCSLPASVAVLGDPCPNISKYLTVIAESGTACENRNLDINCGSLRIKVLTANYGRLSASVCGGRSTDRTDCRSRRAMSTTSIGCNGKSRCIVPASNRVFGDPCIGTSKYLSVTYTCVPSVIMQRKYVCQNRMFILRCPRGRKLMVGYAAFGRQSPSVCRTKTSLRIAPCRSSQQSGAIVKAKCNGKKSCSLPASVGVLGNPCPGISKYLTVLAECVRG
ncbi:L-rhamnose-binding lectin CSL3-like [Diadema antillarum]|uniref:L-rhamnose-binding lectin CSL3-like n=1 Tax=Diadema antillarum TaxID=105358 RepID=UPI003A8B9006